jgi:hypothetical protein
MFSKAGLIDSLRIRKIASDICRVSIPPQLLRIRDHRLDSRHLIQI